MKFSKKTMAIILAATVISYNAPAMLVYGSEVSVSKNSNDVNIEIGSKVSGYNQNINKVEEFTNDIQVNIAENLKKNNKNEISTRESTALERATDITAPVLDVNSLTVDKKQTKVGEKVRVSFKATDDMSGIENAYVYYEKPITTKRKIISLNYNEITGFYEADIDISEFTEAGDWKIWCVLLEDKMSNSMYFYNRNVMYTHDGLYDLSAGDFNVSGTNSDITAPVLDVNSLTIDKKEVKVGEKVKINFKATDDMSGIENAYVYYRSPITRKQKMITMKYNSGGDYYEGYLDIDEMTESGQWEIDNIFLEDKMGNNKEFYNSNIWDLSAGDFNVSGTNADVTAPVLDISSLTIDKKEVKIGERIKISFKATDDMSGIENAEVRYTEYKTASMNYNEITGLYEGYIDIDETTELGKWRILYIMLRDKLENTRVIYNSNVIMYYGDDAGDLSAGDFSVVENINSSVYKDGWFYIGDEWYYYDEDGNIKTGWLNENGTWYYLSDSGVMKTGWLNENGIWYYLSDSGAMKTGWLNENGTWYYLSGSGAMQTGWLNDNGTWYYLLDSGEMSKNIIIDGWKIDENGVGTPI